MVELPIHATVFFQNPLSKDVILKRNNFERNKLKIYDIFYFNTIQEFQQQF